MDKNKVKEIIAELTSIFPDNDPQFLLEKALFLENIFNIQIDDKKMELNNLGSAKKLEKFIFSKL